MDLYLAAKFHPPLMLNLLQNLGKYIGSHSFSPLFCSLNENTAHVHRRTGQNWTGLVVLYCVFTPDPNKKKILFKIIYCKYSFVTLVSYVQDKLLLISQTFL